MNWTNKKDLPGIPAGTVQPEKDGEVDVCRTPHRMSMRRADPRMYPDFFEPVEPPAAPKLRIVLEEVRRTEPGEEIKADEISLRLFDAWHPRIVENFRYHETDGSRPPSPRVIFTARIERADAQAPGPLDGVWRCCCCGELRDEAPDSRWRWNGEIWQHHHGAQCGYFDARNFAANDARVEDPSSPTDTERMDALENADCIEIVDWATGATATPSPSLREFADDLIAKRKEGK